MINRFFEHFNPQCDFCGTMLYAGKSDEEAEEIMRREGWQKRSGKDACRLCLLKEAETGKLPERQRMWEYTEHMQTKEASKTKGDKE